MSVKLLTEHHLEFLLKLNRRLHRLVGIYTYQNATLLGSNHVMKVNERVSQQPYGSK